MTHEADFYPEGHAKDKDLQEKIVLTALHLRSETRPVHFQQTLAKLLTIAGELRDHRT